MASPNDNSFLTVACIRLTAATKLPCFIIPPGNSQLKEKQCTLRAEKELQMVVNCNCD